MYAACGPIRPVSGQGCSFVALYLQFREESDRRSVSEGIQEENKTVDNPKQLTVTMLSIKIIKLLVLQISNILDLPTLGIVIKTNLVNHPFSFRIQFASFEECTLRADPSTQ
jgi:hypothetical protein